MTIDKEFEALFEEAITPETRLALDILQFDEAYCTQFFGMESSYNESVIDDAKKFMKGKVAKLKKRTDEELSKFQKSALYKKLVTAANKVSEKCPKLHPKFKRLVATIAKYAVSVPVVQLVIRLIITKVMPLVTENVLAYAGAAMIGSFITVITFLVAFGATVDVITDYVVKHGEVFAKKSPKKVAKQEATEAPAFDLESDFAKYTAE